MKSPRGYVPSLETVYELDPHLFSLALQHRHIVPKLPNEDVLCIAGDCYEEADEYAVFEGDFEAFDGHTKFGLAPICSRHNYDDITMENVREWTRNNITLNQ